MPKNIQKYALYDLNENVDDNLADLEFISFGA